MQTITFEEYLENYNSSPIIDVRSPSEYNQGHIPNAINFALLNDEERKIVGTCYKQQGHKQAVVKGFELVGSKFANYIVQFEKITTENTIIIHCWRGGLRSNIMAWLLEKGGYKTIVLSGGYKKYRNWVLDTFSTPKKLLILGGKTGSGKTKIIDALAAKNINTINLELIANHRGSAFGGIGKTTQPTQEQFENNLAQHWFKIPNNEKVWIENESRLIGKCVIPSAIFEMMKNAKVLELEVDLQHRIKNIIEEYGNFEKNILIEKTLEIEKKLGNQNMRNSIAALLENDFNNWASILLDYYDKSYQNSKLKRDKSTIFAFNYSNFQSIETLLQFAQNID